MASFSEAEKLLLVFDMVPKFTDLIVFTILSSHLGGQYKKTEGIVLKEYAISSGIPSEKIFVTKDVENTEEEAVAVKELIIPSKRNYNCNIGLSYV